MHVRFAVTTVLAVAAGAGAAASARAANPTVNNFAGSLAVKGTYKRDGDPRVKIKGRNDASSLHTTPDDFQITLAFSPVKGLFTGRKVLAPVSQSDLFSGVSTLLALDGMSHPVDLTTASMKGKGTFSASGVKGKLKLSIHYSGTDATPGDDLAPVSGKLKATFKGTQAAAR